MAPQAPPFVPMDDLPQPQTHSDGNMVYAMGFLGAMLSANFFVVWTEANDSENSHWRTIGRLHQHKSESNSCESKVFERLHDEKQVLHEGLQRDYVQVLGQSQKEPLTVLHMKWFTMHK
jgi:hypothetical protein